MAYGHRSNSSILDTFSLSPLPYPVILILLMVLLLMAISGFFTFEDMIEAAEERMSWALLAAPIILLLAIHCLSSVENFDGGMLGWYPNNRRRPVYYPQQQEGSSPWGVAAVVVLLLVMVSFQSTFQDMWRPGF